MPIRILSPEVASKIAASEGRNIQPLVYYGVSGDSSMKAVESRAEIYLLALQSLSKAEREAVIARLLEDAKLREDILDLALIRQHQAESSRPFKEYLSD